MTHICVSKLTINGSDNGLSPGRRQVIIWTNAVILLVGPLGTNFSEILISLYSFKKMHMKMSSGNWQPSCPSLNVLTITIIWSVNPMDVTDFSEIIGFSGPSFRISLGHRLLLSRTPGAGTSYYSHGNMLDVKCMYLLQWRFVLNIFIQPQLGNIVTTTCICLLLWENQRRNESMDEWLHRTILCGCDYLSMT